MWKGLISHYYHQFLACLMWECCCIEEVVEADSQGFCLLITIIKLLLYVGMISESTAGVACWW